jgi:hypothetical protein
VNPLLVFQYIVAVGGGLAVVLLVFGLVGSALLRLVPNKPKAAPPENLH